VRLHSGRAKRRCWIDLGVEKTLLVLASTEFQVNEMLAMLYAPLANNKGTDIASTFSVSKRAVKPVYKLWNVG
jgi:hypothetical protein